MFLLMVIIGIGFGHLVYRNGALLESGTSETRKPIVRATIDGKSVHSYIVEDRTERRE